DRAGERRHQKKDGTIFTVGIASNRLAFAGSRAELVMAVDITERKVAEQALVGGEARYRDLGDKNHALMSIHALDGRIISVNPWGARVLGYKQDALIGLNIRAGLVPEYRDQFDDYLRGIKKNGFPRGIMKVQTASGETRLWE